MHGAKRAERCEMVNNTALVIPNSACFTTGSGDDDDDDDDDDDVDGIFFSFSFPLSMPSAVNAERAMCMIHCRRDERNNFNASCMAVEDVDDKEDDTDGDDEEEHSPCA